MGAPTFTPGPKSTTSLPLTARHRERGTDALLTDFGASLERGLRPRWASLSP